MCSIADCETICSLEKIKDHENECQYRECTTKMYYRVKTSELESRVNKLTKRIKKLEAEKSTLVDLVDVGARQALRDKEDIQRLKSKIEKLTKDLKAEKHKNTVMKSVNAISMTDPPTSTPLPTCDVPTITARRNRRKKTEIQDRSSG